MMIMSDYTHSVLSIARYMSVYSECVYLHMPSAPGETVGGRAETMLGYVPMTHLGNNLDVISDNSLENPYHSF